MQVILYEDRFGFSPYAVWISSLSDKKLVSRIIIRIDRIELGNLGDHKYLEHGVWELRLFVGPGIRIYFAKVGDEIILLLFGGNKNTQRRDIKKAIEYLKDFLGRQHES